MHRVQRVPATESQGRIHTSAATVAVLPEAEEVDVKIEDKDIRIDVFRASGPGGQSVNTTDSAVRITHLPSGLVVSQQDQKSQLQNKLKAMEVLRARLLDLRVAEQEAERARMRRTQVGTGDRSAKIRTYNFPQSRVTDHRIGWTTHDLQGFMDGEIAPVIEALKLADVEEQLGGDGDGNHAMTTDGLTRARTVARLADELARALDECGIAEPVSESREIVAGAVRRAAVLVAHERRTSK